jgi:hypothetical protein
MRLGLIIAITAVAAFMTAAGADQPFDSFPIGNVYRGPPAMPDFQLRDREFKDFRTRIRNGIKEGANFAGRHKVIQIGCGSGCTFVVVADVSTGQVYNFPHGGETDQMLQLEYRVSSNLIRAWWVQNLDKTDSCLQEGFLLRGGHFLSLGRPGPAACPGYCNDGICKP